MLDSQKLFSPFIHKNIELRNRIVMAPMTRSFCYDGVPNAKVVDYYRRRAAHGVALIVTEGACIDHPGANGHADVPYLHGEAALAGWRKVVQAVHAEGGKIVPQLWHVGALRMFGIEPYPEAPAYSPSGLLSRTQTNGRVMSRQDIDDVIAAFVVAARSAVDVGFDGIEIHAAHGYLIDQFFWRETNQRTDEYGGSMENRVRFACDIVQAIRCEFGVGLPIILRWSQWKLQSYGARLVSSPEELARFLLPLVDAGVDIFHCSTHRFWEPEFEGSDLNLAGWTRKISGLPTVTVGGVGLDPALVVDVAHSGQAAASGSLVNLLARLERDEFDLVAIGRALIADPEWPRKVERGRIADLKLYAKEALATLE